MILTDEGFLVPIAEANALALERDLLRIEIKRLREALEKIKLYAPCETGGPYAIARAALAKEVGL